MHIAIAGNIGAGKTTLAYLLAQYFGYEALYEDNEQNPYLMDFYSDMQRWSFHLQIHFLHSRLGQIKQIRREQRSVIQDRTIYEDAQIFAPNLHALGLMTDKDFENYRAMFDTIADLIQPPDLMIYLSSSIGNLVEQIQQRNRKYEDSIRVDYLNRLNERYNEWFDSYNYGKKIIISVDEWNFRDKPEHLSAIIHRIKSELGTSEK